MVILMYCWISWVQSSSCWYITGLDKLWYITSADCSSSAVHVHHMTFVRVIYHWIGQVVIHRQYTYITWLLSEWYIGLFVLQQYTHITWLLSEQHMHKTYTYIQHSWTLRWHTHITLYLCHVLIHMDRPHKGICTAQPRPDKHVTFMWPPLCLNILTTLLHRRASTSSQPSLQACAQLIVDLFKLSTPSTSS